MQLERKLMAHKWEQATIGDIDQIVGLIEQDYQHEIDKFFTYNASRIRYHLYRAILDQMFQLNTESVLVTRRGDRIIAWSWLTRGKHTVYANEEMAVAEFVHVDLTLSVRERVEIVREVINNWIDFCWWHSIPVLCSTTIRQEQTAFMRIHEQMGFVVRGSIAYRRIK
jgi:hypothetical protein